MDVSMISLDELRPEEHSLGHGETKKGIKVIKKIPAMNSKAWKSTS